MGKGRDYKNYRKLKDRKVKGASDTYKEYIKKYSKSKSKRKD
jgi:hypothetical protein